MIFNYIINVKSQTFKPRFQLDLYYRKHIFKNKLFSFSTITISIIKNKQLVVLKILYKFLEILMIEQYA